MNPTIQPTLRTATPDSEVVASSEDERPWPSATSFGTLPRKENGVPGIGGGIWATGKRGSFKMEKAARGNAAREALLGTVNPARSGMRVDSTPSPAASEGSGALPFAIPLQPTPKTGRSLSHSQGQREMLEAPGARPGSNNHAPGFPLGLLTEEVDTETDSELGGGLTHTTSHPPIGTLQRTSTFPSTYESFYATDHHKDARDSVGGAHASSKLDRKFESGFANLTIDQPQRRAQWQSHLGWDDVPNVNESRRHSLADIPTRRGSLAGTDSRPSLGGGAFYADSFGYDWNGGLHSQAEQHHRDGQQFLDFGDIGGAQNNTIDPPRAIPRPQDHTQFEDDEQDQDATMKNIPAAYKVPRIHVSDRDRAGQEQQPPSIMPAMGWNGGPGRPKKLLYLVSFKCSRVGVFFLLEGTGLNIKAGDIVIVEADRGQDLGTVQHALVTPEEARVLLKKYHEEQYKWLMMFSKNNQQGSVNPNAQVYGENRLTANAPATLQGVPRENFNNLKPKAIKRLASQHEIRMLSEKEGNEAKAKRTCQQKVAHLHLDMEILDAEWQWDFQKLIFYYYADHYINFKDLITELYRIYKTRIWLSAVNPASFSQHALGQPPSGVGPGAVGTFPPGANNSYTMMYGQDPDPYGAVPPYRIGYETYTPNYPGIPGVANSFAPPTNALGPHPAFGAAGMGAPMPPYGTNSGSATPSAAAAQSAYPQTMTAPMSTGIATSIPPFESLYERFNGLSLQSGVQYQAPISAAPGASSSTNTYGGPPPPIGTQRDAHRVPAPSGAFPPNAFPVPSAVSARFPPSPLYNPGLRNAGGAQDTSPNRSYWDARFGQGDADAKAQHMKAYLESVAKEHEDARANAMSRER